MTSLIRPSKDFLAKYGKADSHPLPERFWHPDEFTISALRKNIGA